MSRNLKVVYHTNKHPIRLYECNDNGMVVSIPPPIVLSAAKKYAQVNSTCDRCKVGAVIWRPMLVTNTFPTGFYILGYATNVSPLGHNSKCNVNGHLMVDGHCVRTAHAEMSVISKYIKNKKYPAACIHVTHTPCPHCIKLSMITGLSQITWETNYGNAKGTLEFLKNSQFPYAQVTADDCKSIYPLF